MYLTRSKAKKAMGVIFVAITCFVAIQEIANRQSRVRKDTQESPPLAPGKQRESLMSETARENPSDVNLLHETPLERPSIKQEIANQPPNASSQNNPLYSDEVINQHIVNFTVVNGDACNRNASSQHRKVFLLILVKCRPGDSFPREQIRKTWGGLSEVDGKRILTMFLIGMTTNSTLMAKVVDENRQHGDIIQGDFMDHYLNLTHKTMMGWRWASEFCPGAEYVASADADVLLNLHNIVRRLSERPRERFAEGKVQAGAKPFRGNSKWHTSKETYPEPTYAPYFSGVCYVLSGDVAARVYKESAHVRFLPWDDVYIGLVLKRLGVVPKNVRKYLKFKESYQGIEDALSSGPAVLVGTEKDHAWTTHDRHNAQLVKIWKKVTQKQDATDRTKKKL
ncbi:beta-1,3-galactosyltransferase 5-like [Patiria miniata]|uniref:Hexosyltransferase n=1 Tax=Patiria miniata TaxID=46514 RepID=A0A914B2M7_PATMI|nr:beta-1,3-galactosyltransferase 5-like [Patiria miniata]